LCDPILIEVTLWHESSRSVVKFIEVMLDILWRQILGRIGASALFHREDFVALFGTQTRHRRFVVAVVTAVAIAAVAPVAVAAMAAAAVTRLGCVWPITVAEAGRLV
jgi:hypothetical protein